MGTGERRKEKREKRDTAVQGFGKSASINEGEGKNPKGGRTDDVIQRFTRRTKPMMISAWCWDSSPKNCTILHTVSATVKRKRNTAKPRKSLAFPESVNLVVCIMENEE